MIRFEVLPAGPQAALESVPFHRYRFEDGTVWTEFYRAAGGYLLRFPGLADFSVSADGRRVGAHPSPGTGKSTLAASFALDGAAFLTDDGLLLEKREAGYVVLPSHASLRLWDDSVEALTGHDLPRAASISYSDKTRLLAGDALAHANDPAPLLAAFVLGAGEPASIDIGTLEGGDRYRAWLENSFLLDIEDRDLLARHFDWTHRIASAVPTYRLDYPRDFCILPDVRRALRALVAGA